MMNLQGSLVVLWKMGWTVRLFKVKMEKDWGRIELRTIQEERNVLEGLVKRGDSSPVFWIYRE